MRDFFLKGGVVAGIFWMCMATLLTSFTGAFVRHLGGSVPTMELVFFRNFFALIMLAPWFLRLGASGMRTHRLPLYGLRVTFAYLSMLMQFYALSQMQIAKVYALQFTIPLFTILLAVLVLKQSASIHSWVACLIGFAGALIVMRPGFIEITLAVMLTMFSAVLSAGSNTTIKLLARTESPGVITVYTNLLMMPCAFVPMLFVWVTPTPEQWPWIIGMGVTGSVGGYCFTRAVSSADARVVQPFQFSRMIFATGIGFAMFAELPDLWTWVGAGVIFAASYYVLLHEKNRRQSEGGGR
ncbi:MAG: DMT family transporter [Alphaproteobacteria bacterium]